MKPKPTTLVRKQLRFPENLEKYILSRKRSDGKNYEFTEYIIKLVQEDMRKKGVAWQ